MAPLVLEGGTLGEKHQHYNKLLKEVIANKQPVSDISFNDDDVENLLKIDVACHNRDLDFIFGVFKNSDMLYVSRALKQTIWLITDPQYAHIIEPEYLQTQLLPHMSTKAFIKLNKHIRHNIEDESRAEKFYLHEKKPMDAIKWLPHCSVPFIENNIHKHMDDLKLRTFKRLCEKSINVFEIAYKKAQYYDRQRFAQAVTFFLNADTDKYLNILEKEDSYQKYPNFSEKATHLLMKKCRKRIIDKFEHFVHYVDIPTFTKYLTPDEIKTLLYTQAKKDNDCRQYYNSEKLFKYDTLKYFIKRLPKDEQFQFVKRIFIDKEIADAIEENLTVGTEAYNMKKLFNVVEIPNYLWYRFATFEQAFEEITRLISKDLDNNKKYAMLEVLILCAKHNLQHIQTLLEYFLNKHKNEDSNFVLKFVAELLKHTHINQYDEKTWNLVNDIFKSLKIYDESNDLCLNVDICVDYIIIYNLLNDQKVPMVIEKQFNFRTLKAFESKLNKEQKEKVFRFLYEGQISKVTEPVKNEEEFTKAISTMEKVLQLLRDWKKELLDYPFVIDKIKEFVKIKRQNSWKQYLSTIYSFNKFWRRHLFEESIAMNPCEEVCLNALKHQPELLERYQTEVSTLRSDDGISLRRLLTRLRIYWPHSLAHYWTDAYLQNLNRTNGHKAIIRGLCTTLPQKPLLEFIDKYKPAQAKIDWTSVDDHVLSIQRFLAKNMHRARPQPCPDTILLYAKGDYLQFALPSLLAIFYNLNRTQSQHHIPKLLNAPVSIQKHGIRLAFQKLDFEAIKKIFSDCWKASKNVSIRAIIFKFTFELLRNEKDPSNSIELWELLELFIDNLTFEEDKKIYELLPNVASIPQNVRAKYLLKSYKFMESLIPNLKETDREVYKVLSAQLAQYSRELMEDLPENFVLSIILEFIEKDFFGSEGKFGSINSCDGIISVLSAYLLCSENENIQTQKYKNVLVPIIKRALASWTRSVSSNFQSLLTRLSLDLKEYVINKSKIIPVKMFSSIQSEIEKSLPVSENYLMLTKWKLIVELAKLVEGPDSDKKEWENVCTKIGPQFGKICLDYLKKDVQLYFPCIYKLFSKALNNISESIIAEDAKLEMYNCMLADNDFVQGYLTVIEISAYSYKYHKSRYENLWKQILAHPSVEVKMHYYNRNEDQRRYFS